MSPSECSSKTQHQQHPTGLAIPPHTPHAISVSLPTWADNVGYEEGKEEVMSKMVCGYPRFFLAKGIVKLAKICESKYAIGTEQAMLFRAHKVAEKCREFIIRRHSVLQPASSLSSNPRLVNLFICPEELQGTNTVGAQCAELHIVLFPQEAWTLAKEFWQHTGLGISSRFAEMCLRLLPKASEGGAENTQNLVAARGTALGKNKGLGRYAAVKKGSPTTPTFTASIEDLDPVYLEERYGRNLPLHAAEFAKRALRSRVAGVLVAEGKEEKQDLIIGPSTRDVQDIKADDVYLLPTGMTAIFTAHEAALAVNGKEGEEGKSVCFGFPYIDTLKILQKFGPGCYFLGNGLDEDIDALESILSSSRILALFTEFPSNPLLRSANLPRLRALADKHDFMIVVDETIGNFVNVEVMKYADIVVSSLTKVFSGASNVMGGSLVLNPRSRYYTSLKTYLSDLEDLYFDEDAIFMERNSRDFKSRIKSIDSNAEAICDFLRTQPIVKNVFYPKYITQENYNACRRPGGGFGGLFSLTFVSDTAGKAFFDTLETYKGPSLGTNFTLACPFTILAHYQELEWAEGYGVERGLVRVSVGMEEKEALVSIFKRAVREAELAVVEA